MPTIRKFLDISTSHLSPSSRAMLNDGSLSSCSYRHPEGYGAFVFVPLTVSEDDDYPADLVEIFALARVDDCEYVLLDDDAPGDDRLPSYEGDA